MLQVSHLLTTLELAMNLSALHFAGRILAHSRPDLPYENLLALSDDFSARTASDLCGKEEQLKPELHHLRNWSGRPSQHAHRQSRRSPSHFERMTE
jgi:hypothetical protein